MSSAGEALKAYLVADTAGVNATVSGRIHQNNIPEVSTRPNIWFMRSAEQHLKAMDGLTGLHKASFDVECIAATVDASLDLADQVKTRLDTASSTTAGVNMRAILVEDHTDEYTPKGLGSDDGLHVAALNVTVWYTT